MRYKPLGCFLLGVTGKGVCSDREALLASVSDNPYDIRTFVKKVNKYQKFSHLGTELVSTSEQTLQERGYFAKPGETTRGINEKGLAFTSAMVFEDPKVSTNSIKVPFADLTSKIMQNCQSVEEAIEVFTSKTCIAPAYSILLSDAQGDLAHLELGSFGAHVYKHFSLKNPGVVIAVNCYLSQELRPFNAPNTIMEDKKNNNKARWKRGEELTKKYKENITVHTLMKILSDHKNKERNPKDNPVLENWGYSICNHGTGRNNTFIPENLPWGTVSAEILQPEKRVLWYSYGWPCGSHPKYKDQIFQENSWGKFIPFAFQKSSKERNVIALTTVEGKITPEGKSSISVIL